MVRWEVTVRAFNRRRGEERSFIMVVFEVVNVECVDGTTNKRGNLMVYCIQTALVTSICISYFTAPANVSSAS